MGPIVPGVTTSDPASPATVGPDPTAARYRAPSWAPFAAAGVTVLLWASAFVGIRSAGTYFDPGALALGRLVVAAVVLGVLVALRREPLPRGRDWWLILAVGVLWLGVYNVALNAGEQVLDAGTAAMVVGIGPIFIALLAGWLLREGFPRFLVLGLGVAFAGSVVVGWSISQGGSTPLRGVLLCVLAAATYAGGVVAQKPALKRVSALQITFLGCVIGGLCCLPWAGTLVRQVGAAPAGALWTLVYLGVFPTAIAFTTWAYALRHTSAGRMGATTYVVPALVVLLAWLLLDEVPPLGAVIGGALCLVGVGISRRR